MNKTSIFNRKPVLVFVFVLALTGTIFFLPMHINGSYTCFYHRIFDTDHPAHDHHMADTSNVELQRGMQSMHRGGELVDLYIGHYAIFWWSSVALMLFTVYRLRQYNRHNNKLS